MAAKPPEAHVIFQDGSITQIQLKLVGKVDNIDANSFQEIAQNAKRSCPISKALNAMITLSAELR